MQLYHQTLTKPAIASLALALHLYPIKPREQQDKPKQLCLFRTSSLELFHLTPIKANSKIQFKSFHQEQLFSCICSAEAIAYQDEELRKDIIILTLGNGKYQLLQWRQQSSRFALLDQSMVFSDQSSVMSGLAKPVLGQYIAVNNEAKLVMIAAANWEFKLYAREIGFTGIQLSPLLYFQQPYESINVCFGLVQGMTNASLFYSLRLSLGEDGKKRKRVHKLWKNNTQYEEQIFAIDDLSVHLLIPRIGEGNFIVVGERDIHFSVKAKMYSKRFVQQKGGLQSTYWRRIVKDRKEDLFLLNQFGEINLITIDDANPANSVVIYVDNISPSIAVAVFQKNLFYALSSTEDNFLFQFAGKYRPEDKFEKTRASGKISRQQQVKEEALNRAQYLREVQVVARMENSRQIRDMKIVNLEKAMNNQLLITGGRSGGKKGFFSIIKYGLKIQSWLTIQMLAPSNIWCLKKSVNDRHHSYIVVSYISRRTTVYYFENRSKLTIVNELRLDQQQLTLHVARLADNSIVQIMASRIRHIRQGVFKDKPVVGRIMKAISAPDGRQIAVSLIGGYMVYYQLNSKGELEEIKEFQLNSETNLLDFSPSEPNSLGQSRASSKILAIGKNNYFVSVFLIQSKDIVEVFSRNIKSTIESLVITSNSEGSFSIYVGTNTGRVITIEINQNGDELGIKQDIVGQKAVRLTKINIGKNISIMKLYPQLSISYNLQGQPYECALSLPPLEYISEINVEGIEGCNFVTYFSGSLQFVEISGFGNLLHRVDRELELPGRKLISIDSYLGVLMQGKKCQQKDIWVSRLAVLNPDNGYKLQKNINFDEDQKCVSVCYISQQSRSYLCCGCVVGLKNYPALTYSKPSIQVYSFEKGQTDVQLSLLYAQALDQIPTAMEVYDDKLLVGVGKTLKLFDVSKTKLILRASKGGLGSPINHICSEGEKIFTTQTMNSFTLFRHNPLNKTFQYVGEDILPRFVSCACLVDGDYGVIAGGDKFGNFFVSKLSERIKQEFYTSTSQHVYNEFTDVSKFDSMVAFNVGEVITAIQVGHLDQKKNDSIFYATIDGRIGMFYPFESEEEDMHLQLNQLATQMTKTSLSGVSHQRQFRSFFHPSKGVVDGDLCNIFSSLSEPQKMRLTSILGKQVKDTMALLTAIQNKFN